MMNGSGGAGTPGCLTGLRIALLIAMALLAMAAIASTSLYRGQAGLTVE